MEWMIEVVWVKEVELISSLDNEFCFYSGFLVDLVV